MNYKTRPEILTAPLFIIGLFTLLLNDFLLKEVIANTITGKLSDFAGLFIFPYFFAAFFPIYSRFWYGITAVLFIFWKLPISQDFIDLSNSIGINIYRTVDYSDLLALIVLPFSFIYLNQQLNKKLVSKLPIVVLLVVASVFSFCATTLRQGKEVSLEIYTNKKFSVDKTKWDFLNSLNATIMPNGEYGYATTKDLKDSLFYLHFYMQEPEANLMALVSILESDSNKTVIYLKQITSGFVTYNEDENEKKLKTLKASDFENSFEKALEMQLTNDTISVRHEMSFTNAKYERPN